MYAPIQCNHTLLFMTWRDGVTVQNGAVLLFEITCVFVWSLLYRICCCSSTCPDDDDNNRHIMGYAKHWLRASVDWTKRALFTRWGENANNVHSLEGNLRNMEALCNICRKKYLSMNKYVCICKCFVFISDFVFCCSYWKGNGLASGACWFDWALLICKIIQSLN